MSKPHTDSAHVPPEGETPRPYEQLKQVADTDLAAIAPTVRGSRFRPQMLAWILESTVYYLAGFDIPDQP